MKLATSPGTLKRLRRVPWRFQKTFLTPLQNLQPFVATIVSGHEQLLTATVAMDSVVFEPKNLNALLANHALPPSLQRESTIEVAGNEQVGTLLQAALGDWVDFWFVPKPKPFVIMRTMMNTRRSLPTQNPI